MSILRPLALLGLLLPLLAACDSGDDTPKAPQPTSESAADPNQAYLDRYAEKDDVTVRESGLMYRVLEEGDGETPAEGELVKVHYKGEFVDGAEFDSSYSRGEPAVFPSDRLIPGWVEALSLMQEGDKWELVIPSDLAYGDRGNKSIPGGATLVFQVELLEVVGKPGAQKDGDPQ